MKYRISNQTDDHHLAQQDFAVSIQLLLSVHDSVIFYQEGIPMAHMISREAREHD